MKAKEFYKNINFGDTTAFVYDDPNGSRGVYASGEITEDTFCYTDIDTNFSIVKITEYPNIKEIIVDNFLSEIKPYEGVYDEAYEIVKHKLDSNDVCLGIWIDNNGVTNYMLIL